MIELKATDKRAQKWLIWYKNQYLTTTIYDAYKKPFKNKIDAYHLICDVAALIDGETGFDEYHGRYITVATRPRVIAHNVYKFVTAYCVKKYVNGNPCDCYLIVDTKENTYKIQTPSEWLNDCGAYSHIH